VAPLPRLLVLLVATGCGGDTHSLRLDVVTDLVPAVEFDRVVARIVDVSGSEREAAAARDTLRVATWELGRGDVVVEAGAWLGDELVVSRRVRAKVRGDVGVTAVLSRSCRGVACPEAGDGPAATACLGGRCVPEDCARGDELECGDPQCRSDVDCLASSTPCVRVACESGTCFERADDSACGAGVCVPGTGCVGGDDAGVPVEPDAGVDGGPPLTLLAVTPRAAAATIGAELSLALRGDTTGLRVTLDEDVECEVSATSDGCIAPPTSAGTYDVLVENAAGETDVLVDGFTFHRDGPYQHGSDDDDNTSGVAVDPDGNVYVSGATLGGLDGPGAGGYDAYLVRFDADGTFRWARTFGTDGFDYARDVAVGPDARIYVVGYGEGGVGGEPARGGNDVFVAAFDADGTQAWTTQLGTAEDDEAWDLAVDEDGIYVAGRTRGDLDGTNAGGFDATLHHLGLDGTEDWVRRLGTVADDYGHSVAVDPAGGAYLVGFTHDVLAMDTVNEGEEDVFVSRHAPDGATLWVRQRGGNGSDLAHDVLVLGGEVFVAGATASDLDGETNTGGDDVFVMGFGREGEWRWTRVWGSTENDGTWAICSDGSVLYVAGVTRAPIDGEALVGAADVFVTRLSTGGTRSWTSLFGTDANDSPSGCAGDPRSGLQYVSFNTEGAIDGPPRGGVDIALAKIDATGELR